MVDRVEGANPDEGALRELVRRYHVAWESRHEMAAKGRSVSPIGYVLELTAVPESSAESHDRLDCPDCTAVEEALAQITHAVAPAEVVHVGHGERQIGTAHSHQAEVPATVSVLHRDGHPITAPVTDELRARKDTIVGRLRALGAQEGHWR
jgi:hypothetical protein